MRLSAAMLSVLAIEDVDLLLLLLQAGDIMTVMRVLVLATLLSMASAAAPFGTAPSCSLAGRPQMAGVALYGGQQNVSALPFC